MRLFLLLYFFFSIVFFFHFSESIFLVVFLLVPLEKLKFILSKLFPDIENHGFCGEHDQVLPHIYFFNFWFVINAVLCDSSTRQTSQN